MGNALKTSFSSSFQAEIGVQEDILSNNILAEVALKENQMVIADMIQIASILRSGDTKRIREIFEIQCFSPLQSINFQDISKYSNSLHLAFELQNEEVIDYLCALCLAEQIYDIAVWIHDFRGKNVFDISMEKGDKMIRLLADWGSERYPVEIAMHCQAAKVNLQKKGGQRALKQLEKYQLRIQDNPTLCSRFVSEYSKQSSNLIHKKQHNSFKLMRITEILNVQTQELQVFPQQFKTQDIVQSCFIDDCHLISVFKACILQNHQHLFQKLLPQYVKPQAVLGFNSTCSVQFYKYGQESQLLELDHFFLFSTKQKQYFSSKINLRSVFFNYIEKAWIQIRGGYGQSCGYSVDETILEVLNVPVIARRISKIKGKTQSIDNSDVAQLIEELIQFVNSKFIVILTTKQTCSFSQGKHHSLALKRIEEKEQQFQFQFEETYETKDIHMTLEQLLQEMEYISVGLVRSNYSLTAQEMQCGKILDLVIISECDQFVNLALYCHEIETISCTFQQNTQPSVIRFDRTLNNYFNLSDSPQEQGFTCLKRNEKYTIHIEFLQVVGYRRIVSFCYYSEHPIQIQQRNNHGQENTQIEEME